MSTQFPRFLLEILSGLGFLPCAFFHLWYTSITYIWMEAQEAVSCSFVNENGSQRDESLSFILPFHCWLYPSAEQRPRYHVDKWFIRLYNERKREQRGMDAREIMKKAERRWKKTKANNNRNICRAMVYKKELQ